MADYRDHFARCPRCQVELESARSARACRACRGQWLAFDVLDEMLREMHDGMDVGPPMLKERDGAGGACPDCQGAMAPMELEGAPVEVCKRHGVWFEANGLQQALLGASQREPRSVGKKIPGLQWHIENEDQRRRRRGH